VPDEDDAHVFGARGECQSECKSRLDARLPGVARSFYAVSNKTAVLRSAAPAGVPSRAWHEKFGTQTATVTIAGTEKDGNFTFARASAGAACVGGFRRRNDVPGPIDTLFWRSIITGIPLSSSESDCDVVIKYPRSGPEPFTRRSTRAEVIWTGSGRDDGCPR